MNTLTTTKQTTETKLSTYASILIEAKKKIIKIYEKMGNEKMIDILNTEIEQIKAIYA